MILFLEEAGQRLINILADIGVSVDTAFLKVVAEVSGSKPGGVHKGVGEMEHRVYLAIELFEGDIFGTGGGIARFDDRVVEILGGLFTLGAAAQLFDRPTVSTQGHEVGDIVDVAQLRVFQRGKNIIELRTE